MNGNLQFSSADEYRYHEALVHPALELAGEPRRVLVLGGGDGLAVREILKHPSVEQVVLVDLDPDMTRLSTRFAPLGELNGHSLADRRVTVVNEDAMIWLDRSGGENKPGDKFDAAIVDFPDPSTFALGKLYTTRFYRLLRARSRRMRRSRCNARRRCLLASRIGASCARSKRLGSTFGRITPRCRHSACGDSRWRVGPFEIPAHVAVRLAIPERRGAPRHVSPSGRSRSGAGRDQPARQPGACALPRIGMAALGVKRQQRVAVFMVVKPGYLIPPTLAIEWALRDSNPRLPPCKGGALNQLS